MLHIDLCACNVFENMKLLDSQLLAFIYCFIGITELFASITTLIFSANNSLLVYSQPTLLIIDFNILK